MSTVHAAPTGHARSRLIFARHGQTEYNRTGRLQGQVDIPLNETGERQARQLAASIAANPPDVIVSSPLLRALHTAETIGTACGLEVTTDAAFLERGFGHWEGLRGAEIQERWPEEYADWRAHRTVHGLDVEDRPEVGERVATAARDLLRRYSGGTVLIVGHGAAITLGITTLLGLDTSGFRGIAGLENCHRSALEPLHDDESGHSMRLLSHNMPPDFV